jgi:hypothetical protein
LPPIAPRHAQGKTRCFYHVTGHEGFPRATSTAAQDIKSFLLLFFRKEALS